MRQHRGFTLVELMVAIGLFAIVMTLAMGAYLVMIKLGREAQAVTTGTNNLAYALEHVTRTIRTGRGYGTVPGFACNASGANFFSFRNNKGQAVVYSHETYGCTVAADGTCGSIQESINGGAGVAITDPSVDVNTLSFVCDGEGRASQGDTTQAYVLINISGTVSTGQGRPPKEFNVQTFATMRGRDI